MNLPRTVSSLSKIPPLCSQDVRLEDVHKTGLGSSAALITSLVASLLLHLSIISQEDFTEGPSKGRNLAHNLAQFVHCLAQGKVGSGFDVSAAVFGSQIYTRFDPLRLQPLMEGDAVRVTLVTNLVAYRTNTNFPIEVHSSQHGR
jgi:phosphomevalonate kinase